MYNASASDLICIVLIGRSLLVSYNHCYDRKAGHLSGETTDCTKVFFLLRDDETASVCSCPLEH